tara:strand:+ start:144 stop:530 length:387 start_codon:yes stop_codon:yes gene_type:complete
MTIKKSIVGSLFSMLLVSEMAAADWGDVYYCQMTNFDEIMVEGEKKSWKLEKFQFKLDQTKNAMVFGNTGIFKDQVYKLTNFGNFPGLGRWYANDKYSMTYFQEGKFLYTTNGAVVGIISISADCDKF